ncbi:MAG TPA: glycosyltransferase family 2 protein [Candidatus Cloacimonetes bacterium]|nr:glycosyltransferase family 2 protein [Candidatus Cloacimonadota bacterium]
MSNKLSVTIITKNEESNIERCLESVKWADEIVVVDSDSIDKTVEICRKYNCRIIQTEWLGFGKTKQKAVNTAKYNWIFSIDADEEVTPQLQKKMQSILKNPRADGYRINRRSFYLDRWIQHCGWNKDFPLRLFNRQKGGFNDKPVHESVQIKGKISKINEILKHYTYPDLTSYINKMEHYSSLSAADASNKKQNASVNKAVVHGISKFFEMYFLKAGFLDGKTGLILSINSAFSVYYKYLKIWEKTKSDKN